MLVRRATAIVGSWSGPAFVVRNYLDRQSVPVDRLGYEVLTLATHWRSVRELQHACPDASSRQVRATVARLISAGALERSDRVDRRRVAFEAWQSWTPSAACLHFDTRDPSWAGREEASDIVGTWAMTEPSPGPVKSIKGRRIDLPAVPSTGAFPAVLLARRSWRRFGGDGLDVTQLAALLGLTWGTQRWAHLRSQGQVALKTYPSPGACHALEAYVAVQKVKGLSRGLYHYQSDTHQLVRLPRSPAKMKDWIVDALGGQTWFGPSAAVVFMTAVFPRVQWKYRSSRAYKTVLLEAGHACQTFCLAATWLRLAPFCTAALADSRVDRALGLDGITEGVLYAAGVGTRPPGTVWAPYPEPRLPRTTRPARR